MNTENEQDGPIEYSMARHPFRTSIRLLANLALAFIAISTTAIVTLRYVDPPTSAFMLIARATDGAVAYDWRPLELISENLAMAAIAAEDQKFPRHHGFDLEAIEDAVAGNREGGRVRGGSTISQQVAKNLFLWSGKTYFRKGLEAFLTTVLEGFWSKRRILEIYLNIARFGPHVFGAEAASMRYFAKHAADLDADEAALLAAVLPNPIERRVDDPSESVRARQRWILQQVRQLGGPSYLIKLDERD